MFCTRLRTQRYAIILYSIIVGVFLFIDDEDRRIYEKQIVFVNQVPNSNYIISYYCTIYLKYQCYVMFCYCLSGTYLWGSLPRIFRLVKTCFIIVNIIFILCTYTISLLIL